MNDYEKVNTMPPINHDDILNANDHTIAVKYDTKSNKNNILNPYKY